MRDKEARKDINFLKAHVLIVRECPKCKHETPQIKGGGVLVFSWIPPAYKNYDYLCLVCGAKLECVTESTCRVIKEKK